MVIAPAKTGRERIKSIAVVHKHQTIKETEIKNLNLVLYL